MAARIGSRVFHSNDGLEHPCNCTCEYSDYTSAADQKLGLELANPSCLIDEPERERSPDTPRSSMHGGGSDFELPTHVSGDVSPRQRTASWHSQATDFDDLTCPGARAEQSEAYCQAVYGQLQSVPQSAYVLVGVNAWPTQSQLLTQFSLPSGSSADSLELQAEELNRAADMLLHAAQQAQDNALQIRAQRDDILSASSRPTLRGAEEPTVIEDEEFIEVHSNEKATPDVNWTTVMMRNLPNDYTRDMLLDLLDSHGFRGEYDFIYLPVDFKRQAGLGYAFVNMATNDAAERLFATMQGFSGWSYSSTKVLELAWGEPLQGLEAHVERYRNSPVMHRDVPEKFKPLLFRGQDRVLFPPPTKRLQRPRVHQRRLPAK